MIKKPTSKADLRREIDAQVEEFLQQGSEVDEIPRGLSGRDFADGALKVENWQTGGNRSEWTYLPEVVDTLEKRRQRKLDKKTPLKPRKPRKRLLYDDFGEPLRWVWVDE